MFLLLAVLLIFLGAKYHTFDSLRTAFSYTITPVQYAANIPANLLHGTNNLLITKDTLLTANKKLQQENLLLKVNLQRMQLLEQNNLALQELSNAATKMHTKAMIAHLVTIDLEGFGQQLTINKGVKEHLYIGQPVLDANGIVGQVIFVGATSSKVLLITDPKSAIPVVDVRNGLQAIAIGTGHINDLALANIAETMDVKVGDLLVSSGLGQRFPEGYHIGVVRSVVSVPGEAFAKISVTPAAQLYRNRSLLLIWPPHE